jgi:putative peptide zinc metalloprotease protein
MSNTFVLPSIRVEKIETSLSEPRYMVTLLGQGRRFMIAPKLAELLIQMKEGKSVEEAADALSTRWGCQVSAEDLRYIIEQQLVAKGMAYHKDKAPASISSPARMAARVAEEAIKPLHERLLTGHFRLRLLKQKAVEKFCSPLTVAYEPLSALLSLVMIIATRWMLYSTVEGRFLRQVILQFSPAEYLATLAGMVFVILIHEFGHASAQMKFGLPAGAIGFQLYHYLPAFYTNVSASWRLKPSRRVVVDVGGLYFQSIIASVIYLIYLKTGSIPLLAMVVASDSLCLIAINPFLRFDGYWLLSDALGVPNLQKRSTAIIRQCWARLRGRQADPADLSQINGWRAIVVAFYGVLKNVFWVLLVFLILAKVPNLFATASTTTQNFLSQALEGLKAGDVFLATASVIRLALFLLFVLTLSSMVGTLVLKLWQLARSAAARLRFRQKTGETVGAVRG